MCYGSYQNLLQKLVGVTLVTLFLSGCGAPVATATLVPPTDTPLPPTDTPTLVPPTDTSLPPTDTPTSVSPIDTPLPPTDTPTSISPTAAAPVTSADGPWTTGADMPTGRWEHYTCVVKGEIYVIGGAGPVNQALGTVEVFDPIKETWTEKSEMPTARQGLSTSVVNEKIYAIGGGESSSPSYSQVKTFSTVEEYDPATDTWIEKSPMPSERGWHSANVVDGKIYIIGGSKDWSPSYNHVLTVEVYDPATDTWTQKGDAPRGMGAGSGSVVDGKIYLIGGYGGSQRVDEYNPVTDTWTAKSEMPTPRIGLSTSVVDGKIYATGGFTGRSGGYPGLTTVDVYDPATDTWSTAPDMPSGRFGAYTSVVDWKIYVIGGMERWPGTGLKTVEVFDPS